MGFRFFDERKKPSVIIGCEQKLRKLLCASHRFKIYDTPRIYICFIKYIKKSVKLVYVFVCYDRSDLDMFESALIDKGRQRKS